MGGHKNEDSAVKGAGNVGDRGVHLQLTSGVAI